MKKNNLLITGGTGFVGSNLIKKIGSKYNVFVLSRKKVNVGRAKVIMGDLKKSPLVLDAVKNIDLVVHLAYSKNYPENIRITENLLTACIKNKVKKIIVLSSMSAKRNNPDEYGKNKLEIERIVKKSGLNYTILRPSIIYGGGSTSFDFMLNYLKKVPLITPVIGDGKYSIYPVFVQDVVESIEKCIENKKTDKKEYDIVGGEKIFFVDLVNVLKKDRGIKKKNLFVPIWVCKVFALISPKIISMKNIKNLTEDSLADISAAESDFNYNPVKFGKGIKNGLV